MPKIDGAVLKRMRLEHRLTQPGLAARAGLSVSTIARVESGYQPSEDTIVKLAAGFDMSFLKFLSVVSRTAA